MLDLEDQKPNRKLILSKETVRTLTTSGPGPDGPTKNQSCVQPVPTEVCRESQPTTKGQGCHEPDPPTKGQGCHEPDPPTKGQGCHERH
jgi:hypothetical protein